MTIRVNAFGKTIAFPAGTSPEDIEKHISSNRSLLDPEYKAPETGILGKAAQFGKEFAQNTLGINMGIEDRDSGVSGLIGSLNRGTRQTGRMIGASYDAYTNDLQGVEEYGENSRKAAKMETPEEQMKLLQELQQINREQSVVGQIGDTLGAAGQNKMGTAQLITEQLPNTAVSLGSGYAGFKTGAAAGALFGPAGAGVGGVLGFLGGMFLGNTLLETGAKAIEKSENGFTPDKRDESIKEGAIKGGVITGVDAVTLGLGGKVTGMLSRAAERAGARAEAKVLMDSGVDMTSIATINASLAANPALRSAAKLAGEKAALSSLSTARKTGIAGTGVALETVGEGAGEYLGEWAATGEPDVVDATIEALAGMSQSTIEAAYNYNKIGSRHDIKDVQIQATKINAEREKLGLEKLANAGSVDEAINAAAETVAQKPVTPQDIFDDAAARNDLLRRAELINQQKGVQNEAQVQGTETPAAETDVLSTKPAETLLNQAVTNDGLNSISSQAQLDNEAPASDIIAQNLGKAAKGGATEIILPDNTTLPAEWMVVDADNVKATMKNGINQPRDRTRAAADVQIQQIANQPDYRRMSDSPVMDIGAPTLSSDGAIVGGNGRFEGVSRGYDSGTSAAYRSSLEADAISKGIDPATFAGMKKPVLVRRVTQPFDTKKLAVASNSGGSLEYSALERAKIDAERIGDIDQIDVTDSGDIALTKDNAASIRGALKGYSASELGSFVDNEGNLSQEGSRRLKNAILYSAYGNSKTLSRMVESTDTDMRNITGALTKTAGQAARVRKSISQGGLPKSLDITDNLIEAVEKIGQIRSSGDTVDNYLSQGELFSDIALSEETKEIMTGLSDVMRSQKRMTEFLRATYDLIEKVDVTTENIFGEPDIPKKLEVVKHAKKQTAEQRPGSLFGEESGKESAAKVNNVTSDEAGAKYSRSQEERLKDREKSRKLERALKREGYDFRIQARDVRLGITPDGKGQEAIAAEQIARIFRKRITRIEADGDFKINGVMVPSIPDTIFIDVNTNKAAHVVMGHELSHHMEQDVPEVYQAMVDALMPMIRDVDAYHASRKLDDMKQENVIKEIVGDIMGDNFADPEFWNKVAAYNPNAFRKIADTIISWIKRLVTNAKARGLGSQQWVTDAQKAQDIVAKAVSQYTYTESSFDGLKNKPMFQTAWHGSPHDHDKFSVEHIGKGEGAQAYGYGLYFTDTKEVAEWYKRKLSDDSKLSSLTDRMDRMKVGGDRLLDEYDIEADSLFIDQIASGDINLAVEHAEDRIEIWSSFAKDDSYPFKDYAADKGRAWALLLPEIKNGNVSYSGAGKLYQVELTPEPDEYLLWDKPLSEQSEKVRKILGVRSNVLLEKYYAYRNELKNKYGTMRFHSNLSDAERNKLNSLRKIAGDEDLEIDKTGADFYRSLSGSDEVNKWVNSEAKKGNYSPMEAGNSEERASEYLHSLGIRGIKYMDGSSRGGSQDWQEGLPEGWRYYKEGDDVGIKNGNGLIMASGYGTEAEAHKKVFGEKPSFNYVIFDDKDVEITAKFSKAGNRAKDEEYLSAVNSGDLEKAQKMVDSAAREKGYISGDEYRMMHQAPNREDYNLSTIKEAGIVPDDYWTHPHYYQSDVSERESFQRINSAIDRQKRTGRKAGLAVYRAVPKDVKDSSIRNGDWVSPSREYARGEGESIPGGYRIISAIPNIDNLWWDANSINELGYDDGKEYAYKNTKNNRKLIDAVTYDDNGDIVPLSKRFNQKSDDVRFSKSDRSAQIPDTITIDGKERPTRNSNGKLIHPTEEGIRNFWKWFGNSKIVDDGRPLVVYHGAPDARFVQQDGIFKGTNERFGRQSSGKDRVFWFAKSRSVAKTYADDRRAFDYQAADPGVIDAYLKLENPLVIDAKGKVWREAQQRGKTSDVIEQAQEEGRDGVIIKNVRDNYNDWEGGIRSTPTDTYVVFSSEQIKSATGNTGQFSPDSDDIRFSRAETLSQAGVNTEESANPSGLPEETKTQAFRRRSQDAMLRFKVVQNWLKEQGVSLSEAANVYQRENISKGKAANKIEDFRREQLEQLIKRIAETSKKATGEGKFDLADIATYLEAVHIPEANERMRTIHKDDKATANGITDDQARKVVKQFESMPNFAEFKKLANEVMEIGIDTLDMRLDAGLISQEQYDAYKSTYKNWVPLRGNMSKQGFGKGMSTNAKDKRRMGHGFREEEFVIENLVQDRERAIMQIEKNKVGLSVAEFLMEAMNPNIGTVGNPEKMRVMKDFSYAVTFKGRAVGSFETEAGAKRSIDRIMERKGDLLPEGESFTQTDFSIAKSYDPHIVMMARPQLAENEIQVYVNGHAVRLQLNDIGLARAATNAGIEQVGAIAHGARMFNRFLSKAYTAWSPDFLFMNMARDAYSGTLVLTGKKGAAFAAKAFANYGTAIKELIKGRNDPKQSEWVTRYRAAGGNIGAAYLSDLERVGEDAVAALQEFAGARETYRMVYNEQISKGASVSKARTMAALKAGVAKTKAAPVIGHLFKMLERTNMVIENALRLATFKTAVESGESDQQAAMLSKDLMNFNRKGEIANQMGALYLFYNPGMQGAHIVGEALFTSKHRKQVWSLLGALTTLSFILAEFARGGEDDDDREWENTPDYIKDRNLIFQFGDKQITVPVAYGFGIFHAMGNYLSDLNHGADKSEVAVKLASGMFENFSVFGNPIVGDDGNTEIRMDQVLPTLPKLIMAPGINMDSLGRQIHPVKYQDSVPDSQLMWRSVRGTAYEDIAHFMNDITGGSQYNPGAIDISPNTIKYWVTALTGGAGRFVSDITTGSLNATEGIAPEIENVPVLRKFIREPGVSDSRGAFHKARKEAQNASERFNKALKNGDVFLSQQMLDENHEIIALANYAKQANKMASEARDAIMQIQLDKDVSKAEKKVRIKEIELQERKVYDIFLEIFDKAKNR